MNPVGFKLTFYSSLDNPQVIFSCSHVPNTCGMHHGSHPGVATMRADNQEWLLPHLESPSYVYPRLSVK